MSRTDRNPGQERQALRGVCQDPRTGKTILEHELHLPALDRLPAEDGSSPEVTKGERSFSRTRRSHAEERHRLRSAHDSVPDDILPVPRSGQAVHHVPGRPHPSQEEGLRVHGQHDRKLPRPDRGSLHFQAAGGRAVPEHFRVGTTALWSSPDSTASRSRSDRPPSPSRCALSKPGQTTPTSRGISRSITLNQAFSVGSFGLAYPSDNTLDGALVAYIIGYPGDMGSPLGRQQAFVPGGGGITDYDYRNRLLPDRYDQWSERRGRLLILPMENAGSSRCTM